MIFGKSEPKPEPQAKPETGKPAAAGTAASAAALAAATAAAPGPAKPAAGPTKPAPVPAQAAPGAAPGKRQAATLRYVDRPDIAETFADSISSLVFDGQTLRIEFAVTRVDDVKPGAPITGRRSPACRLVLPPTAAIDLINRMQQIAAALTQAGVAKAAPRAADASKKG
ncbi:MAG TPA: hypothetical protein VEF90_02645 [Xanthobacteraceae bacterium]|nr:hypothetical protein [Xanthobacteraceae bacterium]